MEKPLVIAHHLIWTAYSWWLPNDPRGSTSKTIRSEIVAELGELHFGRKAILPAGKIVREFYGQAADLLSHALLTFDESCRSVIAEAITEVIEKQRYTCYALAILPDHVHAVIRKHKHTAEEMLDHLKGACRDRLIQAGGRDATHPTWTAGHGWKVFLEHPDEVRRAIRYVERNPIQMHLPAQSWSCVSVYDGWPLHPGHSPNSPYARRLRAAGKYP